MDSSTDARQQRIAPIAGANTYKYVVYRTVYDLIQNLDLAPGERLVEQDLSDRFGVSKTPIREALLLLEKDRLIEMVPHTGATVSWLSLADYEQQLFVLDALELPALARVGDRATEADFALWEHDVEAIKEAFDSSDLRTYRATIARLHRSMFSAAGYPRLTELIASVQQALYRYGVLLVDSQEGERARELEVVVRRFELLRRGDVAATARVVKQRHATALAAARRRVAQRDPTILPFLLEGR